MNMKWKSDGLKAVFLGTGVTLGLSMALTTLAAALLGGGILPENLVVPACVITVLSALAGGMMTAGNTGNLKLPLALASCGAYLLIVFVLRGLLFGSVGDRPWLMPLMAVIGALLGGFLSAGRKKKPAGRVRRR